MSISEQYRRAWERGQQREAARRQQEARETAKNYARDRAERVAKEVAEDERIARERAAAFAKDRAAWAKEEETRLKSAMRLGYLTTAGADDADEGPRLTTATGYPWGFDHPRLKRHAACLKCVHTSTGVSASRHVARRSGYTMDVPPTERTEAAR